MDQIFTGENKQTNKEKKTSRIFDLFRGLHCMCFFQWNFSWSMGHFLVLLSNIPYKKSEELPLACLFEIFIGLWLSIPTFCIKGYDYVKHFVCVLVLSVINTGRFKKVFKNGEHYIVISSSIYAKHHINVCSGADLCSPSFSNFSETPCMKVGFDE